MSSASVHAARHALQTVSQSPTRAADDAAVAPAGERPQSSSQSSSRYDDDDEDLCAVGCQSLLLTKDKPISANHSLAEPAPSSNTSGLLHGRAQAMDRHR